MARYPSPTPARRVYVPLNSTAYLFGGRNGSIYLDDILAIDPTDGSTRTITDTLSTGRSAAAAAYHPNRQHVYVFGGSRTSGDLDEIVLFDPATETVTTPADFELPFRLSLASAAYSSVTDHIYILVVLSMACPTIPLYASPLPPMR
ncbi:MAG: hypothetical protein HC893_02935 [Chloroflexaceae bacterium]|nr:hypothetical protein [Chloroflexaceae bacterium]